MPDLQHIVLIKELYPDDSQGRITRSQDGSLSVALDALNFFEYHKNSFLLGNQAHLMLNNDGSGRIAENLDSFEANHTLYTVLTFQKGRGAFKPAETGDRISHADGYDPFHPESSESPPPLS